MSGPRNLVIGILMTAVCSVSGNPTFSFASYYGDHMVLQKAPQAATLWGYGDKPGDVVDITGFDHQLIQAKVDPVNIWYATLPPISDTKNPYTITAKSNNKTIVIKDVLFGDVWICSGQSNMVFTLDMADNATDELNDASNYPNIRVFTAALESSSEPLTDLKSVEEKWSIPSKDTVGHKPWTYFSAVCWLYGKYLYQKRNYPIGLVTSAWGGTAIELWSSPNALAQCGIKQIKHDGVRPGGHSSLWNAMMLPFTKMTIYGAIWYQGEANARSPDTYNCTFPHMISDWRSHWKMNTNGQTSDQFPFGFVQLAGDRDRHKFDIDTGFPDIRWHQTGDMGYVPNYVLSNVFMAVAMDLPDFTSPYGSVHPRHKQAVAQRLVTSAMAVAYKDYDKLRFQGPQPSAYFADHGFRTLGIGYDNGSTHLDIRSTDGFEVCCSPSNTTTCTKYGSQKPHWVPAPIVNYTDSMVTMSYKACAPSEMVMGFRYAWRESPCDYMKCAVYSKDNGLPAPPFLQLGIFMNGRHELPNYQKVLI